MYNVSFQKNEISCTETILYFSLDCAIGVMNDAKRGGFLMGDVWDANTGEIICFFRN